MKRFILIICLVLVWCCNGFCLSLPRTDKKNDTVSKSANESINNVNSNSAEVGKTTITLDVRKIIDNIDESKGDVLTIITVVLGLLTILVTPIVSGIQQQTRLSQEFQSCSKSLYSDNPIEQASAAILLRGFLKKRRVAWFFRIDYTREAKNLIVALLRTSIPTILQKNLADGLSYANSLKGQDLQHVNLIGALIKPKSRIRYETTKLKIYKSKRLSMKSADMFHAVIQDCSINNVNGKGAFFLYAILSGTSFRNCILKNAKFQNANVSHVRFDEDCILDGAVFKDAIGINTAVVKCNGSNVPLIEFLDSEGKFCRKKPQVKYNPSHDKLKVFVSKLGVMDSQQKIQYESLKSIIGNKGDIEFETIERDEYILTSQLIDVSSRMEHCDGCIVFADGYLDVHSGTIHKNLIGNDRQTVENKVFTSPWLHIETALANVKQMPCLIIYDRNLCRDGMFDNAVVESNNKFFLIPYSDDISIQSHTLLYWKGKVVEYHQNKNQR